MFIYKTEFVTHTTSHHVNRLHFPAMTFATVMEEVLLNCMTKFCRQRSFSVPGKKSRKWLYDYTTKMASGTRRVNVKCLTYIKYFISVMFIMKIVKILSPILI